MQTFKVSIEPVSPGTTEDNRSPRKGDGLYVTTPPSRREWCVPMTVAQVTAFQGFMVLLRAGAATTATVSGVTTDGPT